MQLLARPDRRRPALGLKPRRRRYTASNSRAKASARGFLTARKLALPASVVAELRADALERAAPRFNLGAKIE